MLIKSLILLIVCGAFMQIELTYFSCFYFIPGPRYRRPKQPKDKTNDEKRPRTAFSSEQLARLKVRFSSFFHIWLYGYTNIHPYPYPIALRLLCHICTKILTPPAANASWQCGVPSVLNQLATLGRNRK